MALVIDIFKEILIKFHLFKLNEGKIMQIITWWL